MDPFGRWSPQQRLLEEIATQESRGYGPRKRYRLPLGLTVGIIVVILVGVFLILAAGESETETEAQPSSAIAGPASVVLGVSVLPFTMGIKI